MPMPNLRLFDTQARYAVYLACLGLLGLAMQAFIVFKGFHWETGNIPFDPTSTGLGRFRWPAVLVSTAVVALIGLIAAGLGYNSLGERRNQLQKWSWLGMLLGCLIVAFAVIDFVAWRMLAIQVIK